ncbi:MAG TPA: Na+/H+ antiporter subunit E [Candidatus Limiplasma sp.]|nr:Na+/H+ antiporter subunit E [Candidatus Limiplasma sp.]
MLTALFLLWIAFNGRITLEIVGIGIVITGVLYLFCAKFLGYRLKDEIRALRKVPQVISYIFLLLFEIVKASLMLTRIVVNPRYEVKPQLITFHTPLNTTFARSVLANSITLTPGTISVFCEGDKLTVHCLDPIFADGIEDLVFQQRLLKLERLEG